MSWEDYTLDVADALEDAFAGVAVSDPRDYASHNSKRATAKYFGKPVQDELLALHQGRVSSKAYRKTWTCLAGLAVGDPVYISANNTVAKADATDTTKNQVIGYVRYKPTTTTCYLDHFVQKTGLSGLTAGAEVFLSDAGGFSASAGTVRTVVGRAINTTEAWLFGSATEGFGVSLTGTADTVPKFDGAGALEDSNLTDDGTDIVAKPAGVFAVEETGGGSDQLQFSHNGTDALIESTAGDIILEPAGGDVVVRQPGGVAGTDDLKLAHDGTDAFLTSLSGDLVLTPAGGDVIIRQPGGVAGTDDMRLYHDGTNAFIAAESGDLRLMVPNANLKFRITTSQIIAYQAFVPDTANTRVCGGSSNEWLGVYIGEDSTSGLYIGLDQDCRVYYDEATSDQIIASGAPWRFSGTHIELAEQGSAPATPASGYGRVYAKTDGKLYFKNDGGTEYDLTGGTSNETINFIIDGGGSTITTGIKGDIVIDFACTITSVTLLADQSGSIVVDIWKDTYANFAPTDADSITASAVPTISAATKSQDTTLTGWTTSVSAGDILRFNVDSITTIQRCLVSLKVSR